MTLFFNSQTSWLYKLTNDINDKSLFASCVIWKRRMWDLIVKWVLNMNYIKIPTSDQSHKYLIRWNKWMRTNQRSWLSNSWTMNQLNNCIFIPNRACIPLECDLHPSFAHCFTIFQFVKHYGYIKIFCLFFILIEKVKIFDFFYSIKSNMFILSNITKLNLLITS